MVYNVNIVISVKRLIAIFNLIYLLLRILYMMEIRSISVTNENYEIAII